MQFLQIFAVLQAMAMQLKNQEQNILLTKSDIW